MSGETDNDRIQRVSDLLYEASRHIRILTHIDWGADVRQRFFEKGARELPTVSYPPFDPSAPIAIVEEARRSIQSSHVDAWLGRQCNHLEKSARLLAACGTPEFFTQSSQLFGTPNAILPDQRNTSLGLANQFDQLLQGFSKIDVGAPPPACHFAQTVADQISAAAEAMFGDCAPEVIIVNELSANVLAGAKRIRIRRTASFSENDINQLINHEAYIHVATSLNGLAQTKLKILAAGHAGTTRTQEGLAIFSEFISGTIDLDRMRRLADRVLAIQMAIEGADFLDVYRFFLHRVGNEVQAFENTRRVFRGGVLTGGAPFTKDVVYLDGLLRVSNFLQAVVATGRADCLRLLFAGKLDIEDIPVMHELTERGLCDKPQYLPPWASDMRFLLSHLAYSSFLSSMEFSEVKAHYDTLLASIPSHG